MYALSNPRALRRIAPAPSIKKHKAKSKATRQNAEERRQARRSMQRRQCQRRPTKNEAGCGRCRAATARCSPAASKKGPARPKRKDAAPRVRRSGDQITCEDAASAGLQKLLGERPHREPEQLDPEGRKSQAGQKRKQLPEQGQIKQGKGKQRGSLLAVTLSSGWLKCSEGAG